MREGTQTSPVKYDTLGDGQKHPNIQYIVADPMTFSYKKILSGNQNTVLLNVTEFLEPCKYNLTTGLLKRPLDCCDMKLTQTLNSVPGNVDRGVLLVQQQRGEGVEQHRRLRGSHDLGGGRGYPGPDERHSPWNQGIQIYYNSFD